MKRRLIIVAILAISILSASLAKPIIHRAYRTAHAHARKAFGRHAAKKATPLQAASRPNIELSTYRRCYTTREHVSVRLSLYNAKDVAFAVYRVDLPDLVRTSETLATFAKVIKAYPLSGKRPEKSWKYAMGQTYPDQWSEEDVKIPALPAGVYLIRGNTGNAESRTWFAVTDIALVAKRSRTEMLVFAANAVSGRPIPGLSLTSTDARAGHATGCTDKDGVMRGSVQNLTGNLWVYGEQGGQPAFILSGQPPVPEPYSVYNVTDRPIYRPGQRVQYKGTVRERLESPTPGQYNKRPYANKTVTVEVRDSTDALIARRDVKTNANGSYDGALDLAAEPVLGRWQLITIIGKSRSYAGFDVQAYRKPEFTATVKFDSSHVVGGTKIPVTLEARYLFGQPVVGAAVRYTLNFERLEYGADDGNAQPEPYYSGSGVTDANGKFQGVIPTKRLPFNRQLTVQGTVTDSSRRSVSTSGEILITAGAFKLTVTPDRAVYRPGERVTASVQARDYDDKPVAAHVRVQLIETKYDRAHRAYKETTTRDITTNAKGDGTAEFAAPRPGYLNLEARAFDSDDNTIRARGYVWVAGADSEDFDYPTLSLTPDRAAYKPGDTATVLLNTSLVTPHGKIKPPKKSDPDAPVPQERAWALVTVEGEHLYRHMVVPVTSASTALRVPLTEAEFPSAQLSVVLVQNKQIYQQQARLVVQRDEQKLHVAVTSDKAEYRPGDTATYTVTARDSHNKPASAEVSLGVVDAAIYQIAADSTPEIEGFFYPAQQVRVETDFSFSAQYSGGAYQTIPAAPRAPQNQPADGIRVRSHFVDTAYWNAFVQTGADGAAQVQFTVPDNLTTWRATAHAITTDTKVGSATHDALATMPLLVRLELPRFYVENDRAVVSAIVHNNTAEARSVAVSMTSEGLTLTGDGRRNLDVPAHGDKRLDWPATVTGTGSARVRVTADGGADARDAVEMTLPVLADGQKMVKSTAEALSADHPSMTQQIADLPAGASVSMRLSPSIASAALDAMEYEKDCPYDTAESAASGLMSNVIMAGSLRKQGVTRPVSKDLDRTVSIAVQKLYRYQHADGGWNWWEMDQSDSDMSAHVLLALVQARDAGFLVDEQRILRGADYVTRSLADERDPGRRSDWLLALAWARPRDASPLLQTLLKKRDKLDDYGAASLCLALAHTGPNSEAAAATVAAELERTATVQGTTAHWGSDGGGMDWRDDDVGVTAHVLRALLAARPSSSIIPKAVLWLMGNREGKAWSSTRSTAEAVAALAAYMETTHELKPDFHARVLLDGNPVKEFSVSASNAFDEPVTVTLTADQLRGHSTLTVERTGEGLLYVTNTISYIVPEAQAKPIQNGLSVQRSFLIRVADPSAMGLIPSGQDFEVDVDITANSNSRYVVLEEPIPAGCEVSGGDDTGDGGYSRREVRDNKLLFFFDRIAAGQTHVSYNLHAETPGDYHILPSAASLVYFPEVMGTDRIVRARLGEQEAAQ